MNAMLLERDANFSEAFSVAALKVEVEERSPIVVVRLHGEAVSELADDLALELKVPVVQAAQFVILDLAGLSAISRAARLQTLVAFHQALCWRGGEVWLAGLQPAVWLALRLANQDRRFSIRDSVAQVFAS